MFLLGIIPFGLLILAAAANYLLHGPWFVAVTLALVAFVGVTLFGRHYDNVMRADLRQGDRP